MPHIQPTLGGVQPTVPPLGKQKVMKRALLVFVAGLVLTLWASVYFYKSEQGVAAQRHQKLQTELTYGLQEMLAQQTQLLRASSVHLASILVPALNRSQIPATEFENYFLQLKPENHTPGLRSLSLVQRVATTDLENYLAALREQHGAALKLRHAGPARPDNAWVLEQVYPKQGNEAALGLEVGSDPHRQDTMERTQRTSQPVMTPPVQIVQDARRRYGYALYQPIYPSPSRFAAFAAAGQDRLTPQQFLASVVIFEELIRKLPSDVLDRLNIELLYDDGPNATTVYRSPALSSSAAQPDHTQLPNWQTQQQPLTLGGRPFLLKTTATDLLEREMDFSSVWLTGIAGLLVSGLAAFATQMEFRRRQQAELLAQTLTNDNELLATVVRHTHNAVIITDPSGVIVWVNPAFEALSGYGKDEVLGKKPGRVLQFDKTDRHSVQAIRDCLREQKPFRGLIQNRSKNGYEYWLDLEITPYHHKSGELLGFMAIEHDVTPQVRDRQTLEQAVRALQVERDLFSDGPVFTIVWDNQPGWPVLYVSNNVKQVLGYDPGELLRSDFKFADLVHPDDLPRIGDEVKQHIADVSPAYQQDYRLKLKDGSYHWFHDATRLEFDAAGRVAAIRGYLLDTNPLHEAQARLEQEQARLLGILNGTQAGTWEWNVQTNETRFNERWAGILGYTLEELHPVGLDTWERLTHPDDLVQVKQSLAEHFQGNTVLFEHELRMRHKDGRWIWILDRGRLQSRTSNGKPLMMAGIHLDIDARKQADLQLKQAQTLLEAVGSLARIGFWEVDLRNLNITWSEMTRVINEVPADYEPQMDTAMGLYPPGNNREMIDAAFERAMDQHLPWDLELQLRTATGKDLWVRVIGYPVVEDGVCVKLYGSLQDVNDVRVLRDQLSAGNLLLQSLIDNLPIGLVAFNNEQRLMFSNEALISTTGIGYTKLYSQGTTVQGYTRLLGEYMDMEPGKHEALEHGSEDNQVQSRFERQTRDGRTLAVRQTRLPQGGFVATYVDITPLKRAVEQAEAASRSKSQFLANMSHEIRTPMNAILGMLQLMGGTPLNSQQIDYVQKTEGAAKSLLGILNDILDFSKVEAGKMQIAPEPFDLEAFLRDLGTILNGNVGTKKIELLFDIDEHLPAVLTGDALRLKQVLINLAGNAVKFTAEGEVLFKMRIQQQQGDQIIVKFEVRDSGIGISPEQQIRIFEGFSQAEANTARRFGGTGLGLAISKHLVELMGGQLQLDSAIGKGSTFYFELPLVCNATAGAAATLPPPIWPEALANWRVLLIESNPKALQLLDAMFKQLGWQVDMCPNMVAARARLTDLDAQTPPYHAVWLDTNTPGVDPIAFASELKKTAADGQRATPSPRLFLLVRPNDEPKLQERDSTHCVDGWLRKPLTLTGLRSSLLNWAQHGQTLPDASLANGGQRHSEHRKRLEGMRLLLAEDNPINQDVAIQLLQREGALVELAENGQEAIDALAAQPAGFDAVLMDMQMPVIDGLLATRHIRENLKNSTLPIVAMTANAMASDREACLQAGMNDHVGKPFEIDQLVDTLRHNVGWPSLHTAPQASDPAILHVPPSSAPTPDPTLDREGATRRLGGDAAFHAKLLTQFASAAPAQLAQAQEHWNAGEVTQAAALLHTVKGSAVTVGAIALGRALAQAETIAKTSPGAPTLPAFPSQLLTLMQDVLQDTAARPQAPEPLPTAPQPGTASPLATLTRLATLLETQDMEALEYFDEISAAHTLSHLPLIEQLQQAMDDLNFETSLQVVRSMMQAAAETLP